MSFPRLATVSAAAMAGAVAFYVITSSGVAGTVFGAALWSATYSIFSHYAGSSLERGGEKILHRYRGGRCEDDGCKAESGSPETIMSVEDIETVPTAKPAGVENRSTGRAFPALAQRWAPFALSAVALIASVTIAYTDTPGERLIVTERVIEQPVVEERVIVEERETTVTVTVPVYRGATGYSVWPVPSSESPPTSDGAEDGAGTTATTATTTAPSSSVTAPPSTAPPSTDPPATAPPVTSEPVPDSSTVTPSDEN